MKLSECNARQKRAFINIKNAAGWLIGGLENAMLDHAEGTEEYESAKAALADHSGLVRNLYEMATTDLYDEDGFSFGTEEERALKDIRFCGKDWLTERCEARIKKLGY